MIRVLKTHNIEDLIELLENNNIEMIQDIDSLNYYNVPICQDQSKINL